MSDLMTIPDLTQETIPGLDDLEAKPKRKRRTRAEIDGQVSVTGISGSGRSSKRDRELEQIKNALGELFTVLSMGIGFVNQVDSRIVLEKSPPVIDAMVNIAKGNDKVREMLLRFATTSGYAQLASALLMVALPIAANHNVPYVPKAVLFMAGLSDETVELALKTD